MSDEATLHPLTHDQALAVAPRDSVWLSASAGTGKTQVLTARVLRLLLEPGVRPEQILCLTFTRAGATEMAARINETLARWVRADAARLGQELRAIGADIAPDVQARARTLFAAVLDCPGGGLRIDTIHAFAQWLLAVFPEEAGLTAGVRPMEDHERTLLSRQVLADLLLDAEARDDAALLDALASLSVRLGEGAAPAFLMRCATAGGLWRGPGGWGSGPLAPHVRRLLGLGVDEGEAELAARCGDDAFDVDAMRCCHSAYRQWATKTGEAGAEAIAAWLAADPEQRLGDFDGLFKVLFTQTDTIRNQKYLEKREEFFGPAAQAVLANMLAIRDTRALLALADWLAPALTLGRAYALAWEEAKARAGLIDFDDQIARAAALLGQSDMAGWIRYKLDRRFDHLLVDEAQDTNAAQWAIIEALTGDFFAGEGAAGDRACTLFVVGDYKQAIFGFQGTSPENFEAAHGRVRDEMAAAAANAAALRAGPRARELVELGLGQSFRAAAPLLSFVDRAIAHIGHAAFGLDQPPEPHAGAERAGLVTFWRPVGMADDDADDEGGEAEGEAGDGALTSAEYRLANQIAQTVRQWHLKGYPLFKRQKPGEPPRKGDAGDVMVLVRKRGALAALIVARLHAAGVPVAGVDRLRLGAPLAVQDLVAALRFAAQPLDDLNLASLLVSPLIGWTQEQLLAHGWREPAQRPRRAAGHGLSLWQHLRRSRHPDVAAALERLGQLLARADYEPVQVLLHWLLVGPWRAREALVARLGLEAGDPIDELLNAANAFAAAFTPSLAGFIAWFDAGEGELKREAARGQGFVRVMTVHGAKGLEAPIVILADATGNPDAGRPSPLTLTDPASTLGGGEPRDVPLPDLPAAEQRGPIAEAVLAQANAEGEEHWRLLYVAMTRAEEALFITGALAPREKIPAPASWYARLAELCTPGEWIEDALWGARAEHGEAPAMPQWPATAQALPLDAARPGWLARPAPEEAVPARPLVPSSLGEDTAANPPGAGTAAAPAEARRGTLIHHLLERLPDVASAERMGAAEAWLARHAGDMAEAARTEMAQAACSTLADPRWAAIFGADALAEVPVAAQVGGQMITGTIDRLLISPSCIAIVDFKTTRRPPATLAAVPVATLRQMAAYAAALEATYPGRAVAVAVLYTYAPALIEIPEATLAAHKRSLGLAQQSLAL